MSNSPGHDDDGRLPEEYRGEHRHSASYPWLAAGSSRLPARVDLGPSARRLGRLACGAGAAALLLSLVIGYFADPTLGRFLHAYLANWAFILSIALGGLFFVLLQHVTKAGWSVNVRRLAEVLAATLPVVALLALPILISVLAQHGALYPWARPSPELADQPVVAAKRAWLNPWFFALRLVIYFAAWSGLSVWYWRQSTRQDASGDPALTRRMEVVSAPGMILFGLTVTFAAWDLLMSLDPLWYSTIFGVYYFAGAAMGCFATMVLLVYGLQRSGRLRRGVTAEHYHDLGKFLFAFVFFWGYIAFSQYMLIWYGSIPEETGWYQLRGATSVRADMNGWTWVSLALLLGQFVIPFAGLLSRHVKRNATWLAFWAAWVLAFHWLDSMWLVMPQYHHGKAVCLGLVEALALIGIGGVFAGTVLWLASRYSLRPMADPRLEESLAFENV